MTESLLQHSIDLLLDGVDGEVSTRSRVIDGLLDLRLGAADRPDVIGVIDAALVEMPGITTVPNPWWLDTLEQLRASVDNSSVAAN